MDTDDIAPPPKKAKSYELGQDLSKLSVGELQALIDAAQGRDRARRANPSRQAILEERRRVRLQTLTPRRSFFL